MAGLTDIEAYQKSCPMTFNSSHWNNIKFSNNCVASKCMWWRWDNIQHEDGEKRGFCGAIPTPITIQAGSLPASEMEQNNA